MKLVKKWLFPVLTCLLIVGAAVLPPQISRVRDVRQLGQIHSEELAADALPIREPPTFSERLALYARSCTPSETIPSYHTLVEDDAVEEETVRNALILLHEADIIPNNLTERPLKNVTMSRTLLWEPTDSIGRQEPVAFLSFMADHGTGSVWMDLDAESGLPLRLSIYDTGWAAWMSSRRPGPMTELADKYFDLLGLETEQIKSDVSTSAHDTSWERLYFVTENGLRYRISFNAPMLSIDFNISGSEG